MNYHKFISYIVLPSFNIYKLESLVREDKLFNIINTDTIAVIFPELEIIWYDGDLLPFFMTKEEMKEIITGIKNNYRIEINNY